MKVHRVMILVEVEIPLSEVESAHASGAASATPADDVEPVTVRLGNGPRTLRGLGPTPEVADGRR